MARSKKPLWTVISWSHFLGYLERLNGNLVCSVNVNVISEVGNDTREQ